MRIHWRLLLKILSPLSMLYIVMEYCEGGDLGSVIKKCRRSSQRLPEDTIWSYFSQLVQALDACHNGMPVSSTNPDAGTTPAILHRDIKPENVFLNHEEHIKLGDFGLSKQLGTQRTFANTYVGTPYYMSPELATGSSYDIKSDIWALGCVVFELCALSPPFDATSQAELTIKIKSGQVPCLPRGYSRELGDVIREMLALNPRRRPTTRQLLDVPQIKFTLKTLDLTDFAKQLRSKEASLVAREEAVDEREAAINRQGTHSEFSADALTEQLQQTRLELESREAVLHNRAAYLDQQQAMLMDQFEIFKAREAEFQTLLQMEVEARVAAEKESWRAAMLRGPRVSDLSSRNRTTGAQDREAGSSREGAISASSSAVPVTSTSARPSATARPVPLPRRVSGDASMEGITRRATKLAVGSGASGARRRRSAINDLALPAGKDSTASDGWIDTAAESPEENDAQGRPERIRSTHSNSTRASPPSDTIPASSSLAEQYGHGPIPRKSMPRTSAVTRLLEREGYNPAADKSDVTMKDATIDEKENDSMASSGNILRSQMQKARRVTLEQRLAQEAAEEAMEELRRQREEDKLAQTQDKQHKGESDGESAAGDTEAQPQRSHAESEATAKDTRKSAWSDNVPIYDISNDPDLPSPFLRKTKVSPPPQVLKKIKATAPTFTQRSAAVRAATNAQAQATNALAREPPNDRPCAGTNRTTAPLPIRRSTTSNVSSSAAYSGPSSRLLANARPPARPSLSTHALPRRSAVPPLRE